MRRVIKRVGFGASIIITGLGFYLFVHDCLILAQILLPYSDGPAGLIVGPALVVIGVVSTLAILEKSLFPS